ncbi:MAG: hypothetical protein MJ252_23620 [archaeon]|nr:hypothetical protein [archaeon]
MNPSFSYCPKKNMYNQRRYFRPHQNAQTSNYHRPNHISYRRYNNFEVEPQEPSFGLKWFQENTEFSMKVSLATKMGNGSSQEFSGKILKAAEPNFTPSYYLKELPKDVRPFLPLEIYKHQRYIKDSNCPVLPLEITFNIPSNSSQEFFDVTTQFGQSSFQMDITAKTKESECIKEKDFYFLVRGYDQIKTILRCSYEFTQTEEFQKLLDAKTNDSKTVEISGQVFGNGQCFFSLIALVPFGILKEIMNKATNFELDKVIMQNYLNTTTKCPKEICPQLTYLTNTLIVNRGIKIISIKIKYLLPLTVFNTTILTKLQQEEEERRKAEEKARKEEEERKKAVEEQQKIYMQQMMQLQQQNMELYKAQQMAFMQNQLNIWMFNNQKNPQRFLEVCLNYTPNIIEDMNFIYYSFNPEKQPHVNESNFSYFLKASTPIAFLNENTKLKDFFAAFKHAALFGISFILHLGQNKYSKVRMVPYLNKFYIDLKDDSVLQNNSETALNQSMTSEASSQMDISFATIQNETKTIGCSNEDYFIYQLSNMNENLRQIFENNSGLDKVRMKDLKEDSYFSIYWVPSIQPQPNNTSTLTFEEIKDLSVFEISYGIKCPQNLNKIRPLNVLEIKEKDMRGIPIDSSKDLDFNYFWFGNTQKENKEDLSFKLDLLRNRNYYISHLSERKLQYGNLSNHQF